MLIRNDLSANSSKCQASRLPLSLNTAIIEYLLYLLVGLG